MGNRGAKERRASNASNAQKENAAGVNEQPAGDDIKKVKIYIFIFPSAAFLSCQSS